MHSRRAAKIQSSNPSPYLLDPKDWGKYRVPNHVDVNRPRDYKGPLDKEKFPYKED